MLWHVVGLLCASFVVLWLYGGGMLSMRHGVGQVHSKVVKGWEFPITIS
jgi:hypothetical protein